MTEPEPSSVNRRFVLTVPVSIALHVVLVALVLMLFRDRSEHVLFIDLTASEPVTSTDAPASATPARASRPATAASSPLRAGDRRGERASQQKTSNAPPPAATREDSARLPAAPVTEPVPVSPPPDTAPVNPPRERPQSVAEPEMARPAPAAPPVAPAPPPPETSRPQAVTPPSMPASPPAEPPREGGAPTTESRPSSAGFAGARTLEPGSPVPAGRPGGGESADRPMPRGSDGSGGGHGGHGGDDGAAIGGAATAAAARGARGDGEYLGYLGSVRRRLLETLAYPSAARRRSLSGTVHLEIVIRPDGRVGEALVVASSSHPILDDAALEAVRRMPAVPFPPGVTPRALRARLPVVFELR